MDCWSRWSFLPFLRVHRGPCETSFCTVLTSIRCFPISCTYPVRRYETFPLSLHPELWWFFPEWMLFISTMLFISFSDTPLLCPNYIVASRARGNVGVWMNIREIASILKGDTQNSFRDITQNVYLELCWDFCFPRHGLQKMLFVGWLGSYGTIRNFEDSI